MKIRRYTQVQIYIGKEYLFSFFVSFLFFFFIFFINNMLLLAEDVLSKRVPVLDVLLLILYSLPAVVAIAFPFASLVGALMAIGRIASDNETVAFQASGIPLRKLFTPVLVLGLVLSTVSFIMNDYFLPLGTLNFGKLWRNLLSANPELELEPYTVKKFQDSIIITGHAEGRTIDDIVILDSTPDQGKRIISASQGKLLDNEEQKGSVISLELNDVFTQNVPSRKGNEFEYVTSEKMIYNLLLADIAISLYNPTAREMSSVDVYRLIRNRELEMEGKILEQQNKVDRLQRVYHQEYLSSLESIAEGSVFSERAITVLERSYSALKLEQPRKITDRSLQINKLEFHKKFSIPFACFFFVIFAFPVGLLTKRSGRSVGFGVGLFVSIFYWGMLIGGQTLGSRTYFSPVLAMWIPNVVILILGTVFFMVRLKK